MNKQNQNIIFNHSNVDLSVNNYGQLYGSAINLGLAEIIKNDQNFKIVIAPEINSAETLCNELKYFVDTDLSIEFFPDLEVLPYDISAPSNQVIANRSEVLFQLLKGSVDVLVLNATNLLWKLPPQKYFEVGSFSLNVDELFSMQKIGKKLQKIGYERVSTVFNPGEFCIRGSLIDLFSPLYKHPIRIDFDDEKVDLIKHFDIDSQLTLSTTNSATIIPADHYPKSSVAFNFFKTNMRNSFVGNQLEWPLYNFIETYAKSYGVYNYLPFFFESTSSIWDYCRTADIFCVGDIQTPIKNYQKLIEQRFNNQNDSEQPNLNPSELFFDASQTIRKIKRMDPINLQKQKFWKSHKHKSINFDTKPLETLNAFKASSIVGIIKKLFETSASKILLSAGSKSRKTFIENQLRENSMDAIQISSWKQFLERRSGLFITEHPISESFITAKSSIAVIGEMELFGRRSRKRKYRYSAGKDPESIIRDLKDLQVDSLVVHGEHGIGKYKGLSVMMIDDINSEFLTIEYALGDLLHVPVTVMDQVTRFIGPSTDKSILSHLGSDQWKKLCKKTKKQAYDVAAELLDIYANRAIATGNSQVAYQKDYEKFCNGFEYVLTRDQAKATEDVLFDMAALKSMDRLVCGDVGFGKTEVALRAAFTSAINGYQVALLVPTTILAQQHFETFNERFSDWPININMLSRLQSVTKNNQVRAEVKKGTADIVVGTHALLSDKVSYKNLGLVIVDEEHRFGVRHKEKLKALRKDVDYLALTATPIPRTLNMAIGELKDISMIATAPESRIPVKTYINQWNKSLIREACQREISRGGQILFVHNRIDDIENMAENIRQIIPLISLEIAHGRMKERSLERVMMKFYNNEFDLLLATSIIESGLDIPNANTIIINRADRFGLAQLHQLRGRVGRSERQSYAYLMIPSKQTLTDEGKQRLEAIEAIEDLGAGFILASHDLEIRGAGEILGDEQSGQIQKIGFSLYKDMLSQAINSLKDQPEVMASKISSDINLNIPALIPENYMPDVNLRLTMYKRISNTKSKKEIRRIETELIDRFGDLPEQAINLLLIADLKNQANILGIKKIRMNNNYGRLYFDESTSIKGLNIINLIKEEPDVFKMYPDQSLGFKGNFPLVKDRINQVNTILGYLTGDSV
jgi:transcription-repair coupling factor (superfamily II helicase)